VNPLSAASILLLFIFRNKSQTILFSGAPSIELEEFMELRGCPFPTLTWYKAPPHKPDDKVEVQYDEHINKIVSDDSCTLLIQQGKRHDTGLYTLVASNSLGKASKEMRLNVLGKDTSN
uniref:Immunoglobulin I-set domain-containing protein n=1 Tax=Xiphophorus maculatus TaxID=8083 RepID=A0A3B5PYI8_XIPMA